MVSYFFTINEAAVPTPAGSENFFIPQVDEIAFNIGCLCPFWQRVGLKVATAV
jgi:hypothetical protein